MDAGVVSPIEESKKDKRPSPVNLEKMPSVSQDSLPENSTLANKIKVFLKIRPTTTNADSPKEDQDEIFTISNFKNLITKIPVTDSLSSTRQSKNLVKDTNNLRKYKFTRIFPPEISQVQLFDEIAKPNILNFIQGQSSTLICYGTSNAGKTFSLFGSDDFLGIIPRSLKFLFSNIENTESPIYKPGGGSGVINFSEIDRVLDSAGKENLLKISSRKVKNPDAFLNLDLGLKEEGEAGFNGYFYSIWISFVEIYNEGFFDLLNTGEGGKNVQLKLVSDERGNNYLKGVRKVFAATGEEAFQIMMAGKSKLRVASTALNSKSSRSHAIFTLTLLKHSENSAPEDVTVSTLTFSDLAGSGGLRKTQNSLRIKESRSINASLLVLGRCLKTIQRNSIARSNAEITGPFRESNLTRYLQKALSGKENLIILVNLNKSPELYVETQNVLNFVSILNKMTLEVKTPKKSVLSRSSTWISSKVSSCNTSIKPGNTPIMPENSLEVLENTEIPETPGNTPEILVNTPNSDQQMEEYLKLKQENDTLLEELKTLKNGVLNKEFEIRQELVDLYSSKLKDLEKDWRKKSEELDEEREDLLKWSVKQVEDYYKRISNVSNRKRKRFNHEFGHGDSEDSIEDLEAENAKANSKILSLRELVEDLKKRNLDLSIQKSELIFELSITKRELETLKSKFQNEIEIEENCFNARRESFLFEFTEHWTQTNELQEELNEKKEEVESLKSELKAKDLEISEIRRSLKKAEEINLENSLKSGSNDSSIDESNSNRYSKSDSNDRNRSDSKTSSLEVSFPSPDSKISIIEEENSLFDSGSPLVSLRTLVTVPILETLDLSENRLSFLDSSIEKSEKSIRTSDSGIRTSSGTDEFNKIENIDKEIQVDMNQKEFEPCPIEFKSKLDFDKLKSNFESLRIEYKTLGDNYLEKCTKLEDLVQEMEKLRNSISELEATSVVHHQKLEKYEILMASKDQDLNQLDLDKKELEAKHNQMIENWKGKIKEYERKFQDSFKEETEISMSEDLDKYIEKCVNLGNQIKIDQAQLEQKVAKCSTEHIPRIKKLEQELAEKNLMLNHLQEEISEVKTDLSKLEQLDGKIKNFATTLHRNQKEKDDLRKLLQERVTHEKDLESQLSGLSAKIARRDSELLILKESLNHARTTNAINYKNTNELNNLVSESLLKMNSIKSELAKFEETRNNLDRSWAQEYGFLRSQLSVFENQGMLLSMMYGRNEDMLADAIKLKKDLDVKDKEIQEIRKNRDDTIERYDSLVDQLQMDVNVIKQNKEYLSCQEPGKHLKKSISETFKFKKRKSKSKSGKLNPKEDSKIWSSQTVSSSASLESIPKFAGRSCQCRKNSRERKNREVESESILNIISAKLSGFYNNIESQSATTKIRIVDNRNFSQGIQFTEEKLTK